MRAVFNSSWQLLEPSGRTIFAKLSIFRGGFSAEAAQQITNASLFDLDTLIEQSLLTRQGERYIVHELLRQFGQEHLHTDELLQTKYSRYYLALLASAARQVDWRTAACCGDDD